MQIIKQFILESVDVGGADDDGPEGKGMTQGKKWGGRGSKKKDAPGKSAAAKRASKSIKGKALSSSETSSYLKGRMQGGVLGDIKKRLKTGGAKTRKKTKKNISGLVRKWSASKGGAKSEPERYTFLRGLKDSQKKHHKKK